MIPEYQVLPEIDSLHNSLHKKLFGFAFCILQEVATTTPTVDSLPSGYAQFYDKNNTRRLYVNLNNELIYFEGKNV